MKVLFVARHAGYFRNFEHVITLLAARNHSVHLAYEREDAVGGAALVARLAAADSRVTFGEAPHREADDWTRTTTKLRLAVDYLRYLDPMYAGTPQLRARAAHRAPSYAVRFGESRWSRVRPIRWILRRALRSAETALPLSVRIEEFLKEQRPDVMLITPLVGVVGSPQPDYVRAARALGIPTALCVWSWDHLSSKALIRDMPDRVLVWNDVQRDEARRLHGVPSSRIVVTGAQCFDQWFGRQPSRTRDEFCAEVGLPADRPFVLYVGSAVFAGSPPEAEFVLRWIAHLRASADPVLRDAAVLVRPHPQRMAEWDHVDPSAFPNVVVRGGNPVNDAARADYFDALHHSAAVVGLNTSAFLEAAIAGRPVLAILPPEFSDSQEGTIHFHYLTRVAGGLLQTSRTLDGHARQLAEALSGAFDPGRHRPFLEAFIRPQGIGAAATPVFVDAVESLGRMTVAAGLEPASWLGTRALALIRALEASPDRREWMMDEVDRRFHAFRQTKAAARRAQRRAALDAAPGTAEKPAPSHPPQ